MQSKSFESLYPLECREQELGQVVSYLKEGGSVQLVGLPGSGRANILGLLAYNKDVRLKHFPTRHGVVHFVMMNFSEVKRRPHLEVVKYMFLSLGSSLRERDMQEEYEKVDNLFKEALSYNDELVLSQGLKNAIDYLAIEKKLMIIYLFDRFDDYVPQVADDFFTLLRSLRDRAKYRFSVIFALTRPLEDLLEPEIYADFSDFLAGHHVYVQLYDKPSIDFRIAYLEKLTGKSLSQTQKNKLIHLTGGHTRLVKVSTEALLAHEKLSDEAIEQYIFSQPTVEAALKSIWKRLTPDEQADLLKGNYSHCEYFSKSGLILNGQIAIELFADALTNKLFSENRGKITYEESTNTITRGEIVLSDSLTKAEFRLLRYLLQHSGEIVERDDIVQAVWKDDATTEGVTEQAVDQLIFRLRRKIEVDPNNPLHLQTVKGRGIKLVP